LPVLIDFTAFLSYYNCIQTITGELNVSEIFAKNAIMSAFMTLLNSHPFDRISVVDIVKLAGVSRNTFYYWYTDVYALVDDIFYTETKKISQEDESFPSLLDGFRHATRFAGENRKAIYHLYNSISRDKLEKFLYDVTLTDITRVVTGMAAGMDVPPRDIHDLAVFYSVALIGLVTKWLDDGMKEDSDEYLDNLVRLLGDNIQASLARSAASAQA
jgi:AcrR family transcriptional regulator